VKKADVVGSEITSRNLEVITQILGQIMPDRYSNPVPLESESYSWSEYL